MQKIAALYSHWCIADSVRVVINAPGSDATAERKAVASFGPKWVTVADKASMFNRIMTWYALLYVVVEGYRELGLTFAPLDVVLAEGDHCDRLRRFRNAVFHYQVDPFSEKLMDFLDTPESEVWIRSLNTQLEAMFIEHLPIKEILTEITN